MMTRLIVLLLALGTGCLAQSYRYMTVTIAAGQSLSGEANLRFCSPVRLDVPSKTDGVLTFQLSENGTTFRDLYDEYGNVVSVAASTGNRSIRLNPAEFWNIIRIKVRSGTPSSPVNQSSDVTIGIACQMVMPQ